jgi:putative transposase
MKPGIAELFLSYLDQIRQKYVLSLWGYVVMPDHIHLVLKPDNGLSLGAIIGELKSISARSILAQLRENSAIDLGMISRCNGDTPTQSLWQRRCYDHNCRTTEVVVEKINYCHNNPVASGLVDKPGKWRWSSYGWYTGDKNVAIDMDELT